MLEAMAACIATEGYGGINDPPLALERWRRADYWRMEEKEYWLRKARAALRALEFAGVTVVP